MNARRALRGTALVLAALALAVAILAAIGSQMGWFSGKRPSGLGFDGTRFRAAGDWRPNWVSSTVAKDDKHYVEPLAVRGDRAKAWYALASAIEATPGALIVRRDPGYLQVEFRSATLGFVDDAEFAMDPGGAAIHARSAARLGVRDFDVNRKRVERLRSAIPAG